MWHFFRQTTIHPLGHLSRDNSLFVNVVWLSIFLGAFSLSAYQITCNVQQMQRSTYTVKLRPINKDELILPNISICGEHWAVWVNFTVCPSLLVRSGFFLCAQCKVFWSGANKNLAHFARVQKKKWWRAKSCIKIFVIVQSDGSE